MRTRLQVEAHTTTSEDADGSEQDDGGQVADYRADANPDADDGGGDSDGDDDDEAKAADE